MKPTSTTRLQWKGWLRSKRHLFNSNILECKIEDIKDVFVSRAGSVNDSDKVKILLTKSHGYIDIHNEDLEGKLFYIPALPGDKISVGVSTDGTAHEFTFDGNDTSIIYSGSAYALNSTIMLSGNPFTVVGLGGGLIQGQSPPPPATYSLSQTATSINEGGNVTFTVNTANVADATNLFYTLSGTATANDFVGGTLAGSFSINNNTGNFTIIAAGDSVTDDAETFTAYVRTDSTSGTIVATSSQVTIGDVAQTVSIAPSTTSVDEGQAVTFTITTTGYDATDSFYWDIVGTNITTADFVGGQLTGQITTSNNTATLILQPRNDGEADDGETFVVNIRKSSLTGPILATSPTITTSDVSQSVTITQTTTNINEEWNEGGSNGLVTFTISTTGYSAGTNLFWSTLSTAGAVTAADFDDSSESGVFQLDSSGQGTVGRRLKSDRLTEGVEKFKLEIRTDSTSGTIIATSDEITVNDRSLDVGALANGKTFGPVQVNRDNGDASMASDWYTICNIDGIPDGSKIAMFVDGSGSMTPGNVQASIDLLNTKLAARGITIITVTNPSEDWITPFLTELT